MITFKPSRFASAIIASKSASVPNIGSDIAVIGDVVAHIRLRRGEEGREPDRIDAERSDVGQPLDDALDVADAVAARILKGARIDLVDHRTTPPVGGVRTRGFGGWLGHQGILRRNRQVPLGNRLARPMSNGPSVD